jgi:hypothetical protein
MLTRKIHGDRNATVSNRAASTLAAQYSIANVATPTATTARHLARIRAARDWRSSLI